MTHFYELCQLVLIALIFATESCIGSTENRDSVIKVKRFSKIISEKFHYLWPRSYLEPKCVFFFWGGGGGFYCNLAQRSN
jgi:hypothetical protein